MASPYDKPTQCGAFYMALLSSALAPISLFTLFDWFDSRRSIHDPNFIPALIFWSIHLLLIGLTIYLHHLEKRHEALRLRDEILERVDLTLERKRLTSGFLYKVKQIPKVVLHIGVGSSIVLLMGYATTSKIPDPTPFVAIAIFFSVLIPLVDVCHALDCYIFAVHRNRAYEERRKIQQQLARPMEPTLRSPGIE